MIRRILERLAEGGPHPAVVDVDGEASYDDLRSDTARRVAGLRRAGVEAGDRVGLSMGKGRGETAALLATWAVGAVSVPLDGSAPPLRNERILAAAGVRAVFTDDGADAPSGTVPVVAGSAASGASLPPLPPLPPLPNVRPADAAIVLHTSGSTGAPKGVVVRHEGVTAFVDWMCDEWEVGPGARVGALASLTFDLALFEQLAPLAVGGVIVRPDDRTALSVRRLGEFLGRAGVQVLYAVPSFYVRLLSGPERPELSTLATVLFAGDTFPVASLRALRVAYPGRVYANLFGPTETNVCTFHRLAPGEPQDRGLPIGRPCPYAESVVVDDGGEVVGSGVGELCVRGPTALDDYVGDPAPEVARLVVPGHGAAPFVRTGDRVEVGDDGLLWFRGRGDDMLKVRGYRVEPGEVEAVLASHPEVRDAVVRKVADPRLGELLVAAVAVGSTSKATVAPHELRAHAATLLPPYMVPAKIELVDELPRSARGKRRRTTAP